MTGEVVIYRFVDPATHTTESNAESKIELDGDAANPDGTGLFESQTTSGRRRKTDIENAFSNVTNKPDTGSAGLFVEISFLVDEEAAESLIPALLNKWDSEGTSTEAMPKGQLGLRNSKRTAFNLKPAQNSGYKMVEFDIFDDERVGALIPGRILLEHSGDQSVLGTQV